MSCKPILIVDGEPNSVFLEIFLKLLKKIKPKNPIILISSINLIKTQMKKSKFKKKLNLLNSQNINFNKLDNSTINLVNVKYNTSKTSSKETAKSNKYIQNCLEVSFNLIKKYKIKNFINAPINKKNF